MGQRGGAGGTVARGSRAAWSAAALVLATAMVFAPALLSGFLWDDHRLIRNNSAIRDLDALPELLTSPFWQVSTTAGEDTSGYYRPVVTLAYALGYQLFGSDPLGYHALNLSLHVACTLLAFAWLRRRLGDDARALSGCLLGAALFALHPSRPQSVVWISGSTDLWMTLFVLAGLNAWQRVRDPWRMAATALLFLCALLSKESAVVVPLLLVGDALLGPRRRTDLKPAAVVCVVVATAAALRVALLPVGARIGASLWVQPLERVLSTLGHYIALVVWPFEPSFLRALQFQDASGRVLFEPWSVALGAAGLLVAVLLSTLAWRNPRARPWLADAAWFFIPLLPVLNIIPLNLKPLVAERFLYLPMLGVCALLARLVTRQGQKRWRHLALAAGSLFVLASGIIVLRYLPHLGDDARLWRHELALNPRSTLALQSVAELELADGRLDEGLQLIARGFRAASEFHEDERRLRFVLMAARAILEHTPDIEQDRLRRVRRFYDRLARSPRAVLATEPIRLRADISPQDHARLRANVDDFLVPRALSHARTLNLRQAESQLTEAVDAHPSSAYAWRSLALVRARLGEWDAARQAIGRALAVAPGQPHNHRVKQAIERAQRLDVQARRDAGQAAVARAHMFLTLGAPQLARRELDRSLQAHPDQRALIVARAQVDAADGRVELARARLREASRRLPGGPWEHALRELDRLEAARRGAP